MHVSESISDENRYYSDQGQEVIDGLRTRSESDNNDELDELIGNMQMEDASGSSTTTYDSEDEELETGQEFTHDTLQFLINMDDEVIAKGRMYVTRELKCAVKFMQWQACGTSSIRQYDKMREVLRESDINIPSIKSTKNKLFQRLGFKAEKIACCPDLHIAYAGKYRHARRCKVCHKPRYNDHMPSDDDYPDQATDSDSEQESHRHPVLNANQMVSKPQNCPSLTNP